MKEAIKYAAIRQGGKVYTGRRHHEIIFVMVEDGIKPPVRGCQGFVTSTGRFVDRREAFQIAVAAGQVREDSGGRNQTLFSEDIL